jgi:hypothetical protein
MRRRPDPHSSGVGLLAEDRLPPVPYVHCADAFRQFYERGGHAPLLDALTDLEGDPVMRGWLVEYLRLALEP